MNKSLVIHRRKKSFKIFWFSNVHISKLKSVRGFLQRVQTQEHSCRGVGGTETNKNRNGDACKIYTQALKWTLTCGVLEAVHFRASAKICSYFSGSYPPSFRFQNLAYKRCGHTSSLAWTQAHPCAHSLRQPLLHAFAHSPQRALPFACTLLQTLSYLHSWPRTILRALSLALSRAPFCAHSVARMSGAIYQAILSIGSGVIKADLLLQSCC